LPKPEIGQFTLVGTAEQRHWESEAKRLASLEFNAAIINGSQFVVIEVSIMSC
jgi:hypothetical protein